MTATESGPSPTSNSEFQVLIDLAEAELAAARAALELEPNEFFEKLSNGRSWPSPVSSLAERQPQRHPAEEPRSSSGSRAEAASRRGPLCRR